MERKKNLARVLFQFEKTSLIIIALIFLGNVLVNLLVSILVESLTFSFFITQFVSNLLLFTFIYIMSTGINQMINVIPFLVSLNVPRSRLAKSITVNGLKRVSFVTVFFFLIKIILNKAAYYSMPIILGMDLSTGSLIEDLLLALIVFLVLSLAYSFIIFLGLVGGKYGWEYLLGIIFIALGTVFFLIRSLILLFAFGWRSSVWLLLLIVLFAGLSILNYRLIRNYEYKY